MARRKKHFLRIGLSRRRLSGLSPFCLDQVPHHESACYRLQSLLREAGETEKAAQLLQHFQALKASKSGITFQMKYGEMGRYAEVIRAFEGSRAQRPSNATKEPL